MPLILVATPIGNLGDLSPRAAEALRTADVVCCEDTRRTGRLFQLTGIERSSPFLRLDDHTEAARVPEILDRLANGQRVVVVSDAGTPGIADPGATLVAAAAAAGHAVEVVPGPSAAVSALVSSGLPTARWVFEGFLPRKGASRAERLAELGSERRTIVLYESPPRLARTLSDLADALGPDRRVAVARELTKLHEEVVRSTLRDAAAWAEAEPPLGELVVVVEGAPAATPASPDDIHAAVTAALAAGLSARDAATRVAADLGVARKTAYDAALRAR